MKKMLSALCIATIGLGLLAGCGKKPAEVPASASTVKTDVTASADDQFEAIKKKGEIVVGLDDAFVPMGFRNEKNEIVGFDVDLAKEAAARLGLKATFQPIDWTMKENELNQKAIDLIWNGYSVTDERKEKVLFTDAYLKNKQSIVVMADSSIRSIKDLTDAKVGTQDQSSGLDAINAAGLAEQFDGGEPSLYGNFNEAFIDLENGRIEALVVDEILAKYYTAQKGAEKFFILEEDLGTEDYAVGIRKTDASLQKALNDVLKQMKEDGSAAKISETWFGSDIIAK